jgi:Fe-S-cluster-containing dehydrogenase component/formate-dependent nitrite reductase membrane component NrfD
MRYGFVLDQDRCIGCHACTVACKEEHQVPIGVFRTWVKYIEKGEFPHTSRHFGVMRCNHCDSAPCAEICPTHALYRRSDGIIDFDNRRCIGCKACMQACPYDALYIDPNSNTAAKCNFCAHRVEAKLEPACVIVCPTQAIIAGDLDNPASKVSRTVATQKVSVRKPHKGTQPKLYYVGIEGDLLEPTRLSRQNTYVFAEQRDHREKEKNFDPAVTREIYDVAHPAPWGWKIAAYLWTKSIAAGVMLVAAIFLALSSTMRGWIFTVVSPLISLAALGITSLLLILDLKRPDRFYYLLIKPNPRSWLAIGGYILLAFGLADVGWLLAGIYLDDIPGILVFLNAVLAFASACYSAFLFAQAKGRDLWQSTMFIWHLLVHALLAGLAILLLTSVLNDSYETQNASLDMLLIFLPVSLLMILAEVALPHGSEDTRHAIRALVGGKLSEKFWWGAIGLGVIVPFLLGLTARNSEVLSSVVAGLVLAGIWFWEDLWVKAGQSVPLS